MLKRIILALLALSVFLLLLGVYVRYAKSAMRLKEVRSSLAALQLHYAKFDGFTQIKSDPLSSHCDEGTLFMSDYREYNCTLKYTYLFVSKEKPDFIRLQKVLNELLLRDDFSIAYRYSEKDTLPITLIPSRMEDGEWDGRFFQSKITNPQLTFAKRIENTAMLSSPSIAITIIDFTAYPEYAKQRFTYWGGYVDEKNEQYSTSPYRMSVVISRTYDTCQIYFLPCGMLLAD